MKQVALLKGHKFKVSAVAFTRNGRYIASGRRRDMMSEYAQATSAVVIIL